MTPDELLTTAREFIVRPDATAAGVWPRTTAFLTRQALEGAVDAYWAAKPDTEPMRDATMRSKLTCLPCYLDPPTARQITFTYHALCGACHYHPYELAPTAAELHRWISDVAAFVGLLQLTVYAPY